MQFVELTARSLNVSERHDHRPKVEPRDSSRNARESAAGKKRRDGWWLTYAPLTF